MTDFTPLQSLAGGLLIGLSAFLLMLTHGRIAGMTGILAGVLPPFPRDWQWRALFLLGSILSPMIYQHWVAPIVIDVPISRLSMIIGGLIVGVGVVFGSGCTSGHGVCGIARLSPRSIVATIIFMATGIATVFVARHLM